MAEPNDLAIVVLAYRRADSLKRLLDSLKNLQCPIPVDLYISIDGGGSSEVLDLAKHYSWMVGAFEVIEQPINLGVPDHNLFAGDMTSQHSHVLVLEDDLQLSPMALCYVLAATRAYDDDERIAGIGLYKRLFNHTAQLPFQPLGGDGDIYFMQMPCTWGQVWERHKWRKFREWLASRPLDMQDSLGDRIPPRVRRWPEPSWEKRFQEYLVDTDRYFAYPHVSYSTNWSEIGRHVPLEVSTYQVPLAWGWADPQMNSLEATIGVYDAYCELLPNRFESVLDKQNVVVDLYGTKPRSINNNDSWWLTTKPVMQPARSYARQLRPHEMNVLMQVPGETINLARRTHLQPVDEERFDDSPATTDYYYAGITAKSAARLAVSRVMNRMKHLKNRMLVS